MATGDLRQKFSGTRDNNLDFLSNCDHAERLIGAAGHQVVLSR
jgi:hypothetical protein